MGAIKVYFFTVGEYLWCSWVYHIVIWKIRFTVQVNFIMAHASFIDILLAILLPPLGVFLRYECNSEFWICVLLTLFGWIPGIIYAVYVLTK
jgi:uncharacterized membrane protein YqaE (UPF0057 family)